MSRKCLVIFTASLGRILPTSFKFPWNTLNECNINPEEVRLYNYIHCPHLRRLEEVEKSKDNIQGEEKPRNNDVKRRKKNWFLDE